MPNFLMTNKTTDRLLFTKVSMKDFNEWLPFHQEPLSNAYWSGLPKNPEVACKKQLIKTLERYKNNTGGLNALRSKKDNTLIGLSGLLIQNINGIEELEIGYSILPKYWRKGYALEAASECKKVAFENDWATSLISIIQVQNIPSQKTAIKNGMQVDFKTNYHNNPVYIYRINK